MKKLFHPQWFAVIVTLALSVAGFFIRRSQLLYEIQPDGSLAAGSRLHIVLLILSVMLVAVLIALLFPLRKYTSCSRFFTAAFLPNALQLLSAIALVAGNLLLQLRGADPQPAYAAQTLAVTQVLTTLLPPLGMLSAVCIGLFAVLRILDRKPSALLYMAASIYLVVRLIVCFQAWNTDPSIHDYCLQLLAAICTMLAMFQLAGFCFDRGKRRITLFWSLLAVVFCSMTAADMLVQGRADQSLINAALLLSMAVSAFQLLFPRGKESVPDDAQDTAVSDDAQDTAVPDENASDINAE